MPKPIGQPAHETVMNGFPADMGTRGAGGALVHSPPSRPGPGGTLPYFSVQGCAVEAGRVASTQP
jgi:predicted enzyme related to lactoylglutathione lyase